MEEVQNTDQIDQIVKLLLSTFSARSGIEQKQAEQNLSQFLENDPNFIKNLLIISSRSDIDDKIKESACTYINTGMVIMLNDKRCTDEQKIQWADLFMNAFKEPSILLKNKLKLTYPLNLILNSSKEFILVCVSLYDFNEKEEKIRLVLWMQLQEIFFKEIAIFTKILEWLNVKERQFVTASLLGLQVVISSISETQYLYKIFDAVELGFCETAEYFLKPLSDLFSAQIKDCHPPNLSELVQKNIVESLNILTLWAQTLKKIVTQFQSKDNASHTMLMQKILTSEKVAEKVFNILGLNAYNNSKLEQNSFLQNCIISMTGIEAIDEGLNELKFIVLSITRNLLFFTFDKRPKLKVDGNMFFSMLNTLLPQLFKSLFHFCNQSKYRPTMHFHNTIDHSIFIDKLLTTILKVIAESGQQMEFYSLFQSNLQSILVDVLFPLASTTQAEIEMMKESPEDFISIQEDCCHKQVSESYKVAAFKVIETIVDFIDGGLLSVGTYAIYIAQYALNCQSADEIDKRFPQILCFKQSVFLNTLAKDILLDTAFLIISDVQYKLEEREDLVELLQNMIKDNLYAITNPQMSGKKSFFLFILYFQEIIIFTNNYFRNPKSNFIFLKEKYNIDYFSLMQQINNMNIKIDVVKCRLCCFMSLYYDKLFWNVQDIPAIEQCVNMVFSFLQYTSEEQRAVQLSAIEALDTMYFDQEYSQRLVQTIFQAIQTLMKYLPSIDYPRYFDLIYSVAVKFSSIIKENQEALSSILDGLNNKIFIEYDKVKSGQQNSTICINKVMSIIKGICENKHYMPTFINMIEQKLHQVIIKIQDPIGANFEDDLLLILLSLMKHSNQLTDLTKSMLPLFPMFFKNNNQVLQNMFQALNYVLVHGSDYLKANPNILQSLAEICILSLFTKNKEGVYCTDSDRAQGATLLQILIQSAGGVLPNEIMSVIISKTIERLQQSSTKKSDSKSKFFRIRLLGVILLGLASNFSGVQQLLVTSNVIESVLQQILNYGSGISNQYDRKIFIICLSQILVQEPDSLSNEIKNHFASLLQLTMSILLNQQKDEEKNFKKAQKKQNKTSDKSKKKSRQDDSDDEDEEDDDWGSDSDDNSDSDTSKDYEQPNFDIDLTPIQEEALEDKITLENMLNPFKPIDEFNCFKQKIFSLKQQRPQFFQQLIQNLSKESVDQLQKIFSIERVETQIPNNSKKDETKTQPIPRKIIKAKRKEQNQQKFDVEN